MPNASNMIEATEWCDTARKLVGKRKKKSDEVKLAVSQLDEARKTLENQLNELKLLNGKVFADYRDRFRILSGKAILAAESKNDELLVAAAKALHDLGEAAKDAIADQKALAKALVKFDEDYAKLQIKLAESSGLRGARTDGSPVKAALDTAAQHMESAQGLRATAEKMKSPVDMETARGLLDAVRGKLAEAKSKSESTDQNAKEYLKAMKTWSELKPKVQEALQEMSTLPGAENMRKALLIKYNEATTAIKQVDGVWQGHDVAIEKVKLYAELLRLGREASVELMAKGLPENVVAAIRLLNAQRLRHGEVAPAFAAQVYQEQAQDLAQFARSKPGEAVTKINELRETVKGDADRLVNEKAAAELESNKFTTLLSSMETLEVPVTLYASQKLVGNSALQGEIVERQWAGAGAKLKSANGVLTGIETEFKTLGGDWKSKRSTLEDVLKQAAALIAFPVVARPAQVLRDLANETLKAFVGGNLALGIQAFNAAKAGDPPVPLADALAALQKTAKEKGVPVDDPGKQTAFVEALKKGGSDTYAALNTSRSAVRAHLDKFDLTPAQRQLLEKDWIAQVNAIGDEWQKYRETASGDAASVEKAAKAVIEKLKKLVGTLTDLKLKDIKKKADVLSVAKAEDNSEKAPQRVQEFINWLKERGVDVSADQRDLDGKQVGLRDIYAHLEAKEADLLQARAKGRRDMLDKVTNEIDKPLNKIKGSLSATYKQELEQASLDIKQMVNTGDSELLAVAAKMQERLKTQVEAIAAQPKLYAKNKTALENLASQIGELLDKLPETQRRLETAWQEEFVLSKNTDPREMEARIVEFTKQVERAKALVLARDLEVAEYRRIKTAVRNQYAKVKDLVKAPEFETYYLARIAEAKGLKAQENGQKKAQDILKALLEKLNKVSADPNPKAAMTALNADEQQNQRLVVDMAQQYEREVSVFLSTVLPEAKKATKDAEDGDSDLAKSLEGVVSAAGKIVEPYLKNLTLLKSGAMPSPDMARLKSDFQQARGMLADANRTAQRLIQNPDTTNVSGPEMGELAKDGLAKLIRKWGERTQAFNAAVRSVAGALRAASTGDSQENIANAEKAAKIVEGLSSMFRSEAFASSFSVLMEPKPKDKGEQATLQKKQLTARESALRVMRQCHSDLLNPLLMKLTDTKSNPFEAPTIKIAASGISTVLKEIQLQALASA